MRRPRSLAAFLLLAAALLAPQSAAGQAPTRTPGQLVVGLSMPAAGFQVGAVRGREVLFARGLEIDRARALATELAIPAVRYVNDERFETLIGPGPKDWDLAIAQITITQERSRRFAFSRPYLRADQGVLLRRGLTLERGTLAGLRGLRLYRIAFEPGSALRPLVDGALTRLEQDGTLRRLARRWLTTDVSSLPVLR